MSPKAAPSGRSAAEFWLGREDLAPLGLFRIVFGALLFNWFWQLGPHLAEFYTDDGMLPRRVALESYGADRLSVLNLFGDWWAVAIFWLVSCAAALLVMMGIRTRLALAIAFLALISFQQRNPWNLDGSDFVYRTLAFWLIFTAAGDRFSIDAALRRVRGEGPTRRGPALPIRILQLQVAWIYLATGLEKLGGSLWIQGTAVYYALRLSHTFARSWAEPLTDIDLFVRAGSWGTLALEFAFLPAAFFPVGQPAIRLLAVAGAALLQLLILATMNVGNFPVIMLAALIPFLPSRWIERILDMGRILFRGPRGILYYNGHCHFCERTAAFLEATDLYSTLRLVNFRRADLEAAGLARHELEQRIHFAKADGRVYSGFAAIARAGKGIPVLFPLGLLVRVPILGRLIAQAYDWIAQRRWFPLAIPGGPCTMHASAAPAAVTTVRPDRTMPLPMRAFGAAALVFLAVAAFGTGMPRTVSPFGTAGPVMGLLRVISLDQRWDMFAPDPVRYDFWIWAPGELEDGAEVALIDSGGHPLTRDAIPVDSPDDGRPRQPDALYTRWLRVHERIALFEELRNEYAWMYCRLLNRDTVGGARLRRFDIFYTERLLPPPRGGAPELRMFHLWTHRCF